MLFKRHKNPVVESDDLLISTYPLQLAGLHHSPPWSTLYFTFIMIASVMGLCSYILKLVSDYSTEKFLITIQAIHWGVCHLTTIIPLAYMKYHSHIIHEQIRLVKNGFFKYPHPRSPDQKKIIKEVNWLVNFNTKGFTNTCYFTLFVVTCKEHFLGYLFPEPDDEEAWKLIYPAKFGFKINSTPKYLFVLSLQVVFGTFVSFIGINLLVHYANMCTHTLGQIKILKLEFVRAFEDEDGELRKPQETVAHLKECIQHHRLILKFVKDINKFYHAAMFTMLLISGAMLCTAAFLLTDPNTGFHNVVALLTISVPEILIVFGYTFFSQSIISENESLTNTLYGTPWYNSSPQVKYIVQVVIMRTQKRLGFTVGGNQQPLTLNTFSEVIQTSYSYFNMLIATRKP